MSNHSAALLMGKMFHSLANSNNIPETQETALTIWVRTQPWDFQADEMHADYALLKLGLARRMTVQECEKEGIDEGFYYYGEKEFEVIKSISKPELITNPVLDPLIEICDEYIKNPDVKDGQHYIFETAMECFYGKSVWDFINTKH